MHAVFDSLGPVFKLLEVGRVCSSENVKDGGNTLLVQLLTDAGHVLVALLPKVNLVGGELNVCALVHVRCTEHVLHLARPADDGCFEALHEVAIGKHLGDGPVKLFVGHIEHRVVVRLAGHVCEGGHEAVHAGSKLVAHAVWPLLRSVGHEGREEIVHEAHEAAQVVLLQHASVHNLVKL